MIGDFLRWVVEKQLAGSCLLVCVLVCSSKHFREKTDGPIGTGEAPFDAPERGRDDGADCGAIGPNRHVARAAT